MFAEQDVNSKKPGPLQPDEEPGLRSGRRGCQYSVHRPAPGPGGPAYRCNMVHGVTVPACHQHRDRAHPQTQ